MDNSYFIYNNADKTLDIERFHICTWEFRNNSTLIEFGAEIFAYSIRGQESVSISLYVPWFSAGCTTEDFYDKLKLSSNSKFIFNDSILNTHSFDGGDGNEGVVHEFYSRNKLCIHPIELKNDFVNKRVEISINLRRYKEYCAEKNESTNLYIRFAIKPNFRNISTRKNGINKSTILYDIKLNERRNMPEALSKEIVAKHICQIKACFCFNIVPNNYDLVFFDNSALQNVRTLEYESFNRYLADRRIEKDELIVVFSKKKKDVPFSFFAIYAKERIGSGQFAAAIFINFVCGIFLFIPSYRKSGQPNFTFWNVWYNLPSEIWIASGVAFLTLLLLLVPSITIWLSKLFSKNKFN
jgi:hypothetical protein